jgi:soluble lytic murein transglycosylase-like protein
VVPPPPGDLQAVFTALARRAKLPTGPGATPGTVLRAAGLPLLMASVMAGAQALPAGATTATPTPPPGTSDGWTVTNHAEPAAPQSGSPRTTSRAPSPTGASDHSGTSRDHSGTSRDHSGTSRPAAATGARPRPQPTPASRPRPTTRTSRPQVTYTVRVGDTLSEIAALSGRSLSSLRELNHLRPDSTIRPGQVLVLTSQAGRTATPRKSAAPRKTAAPGKTATPRKSAAPSNATRPRPASPSATTPYVVKKGDTLIDICTRHHADLRAVLALNHLRMSSVIWPGQRLLLPASPANPQKTYPPAVVAASDVNRRALTKRKVPSPGQVKVMIAATARKHGVDPALALAIAYQESRLNQRTVSSANAIGVMQITPSVGKWVSSVLGLGKPLDLLDAQDNITAGVVLLAVLTETADTEPQIIAGYYQGLSSVRKNGMLNDTRRYVANVQTLRSRFAKTL